MVNVMIEPINFLPFLKPLLGREEGVVGLAREGGREGGREGRDGVRNKKFWK